MADSRERHYLRSVVAPGPSPITAARVIAHLCTAEERRENHTEHRGFVAVGDGYEFVGAVGGWTTSGAIRLLPDGGSWPYAFALAADAERAMIHYVEGDLAVCVYDDEGAYRRALVAYAESGD